MRLYEVSILVGTRHRPDALSRLVHSIQRHTVGIDWQLLIADASDEPSTYHFGDSRIKIIEERPRLYFAAGLNRLATFARGDWLVWLNDDVEVLPDWLENMLASLRVAEGAGLGCFYYAVVADGKQFSFHVNEWHGLLYANFGCLRREMFQAVGGFDERCPMYGVDNSLTFRVMNVGLGVTAIPSAKILHHVERDDERVKNESGDSGSAARELLQREWSQHFARFQQEQARFRPRDLVLV